MIGELLDSNQYITVYIETYSDHTCSTFDTLLIFRFHEGYQEAASLLEVSRLAANRQASASSANQLTSKASYNHTPSYIHISNPRVRDRPNAIPALRCTSRKRRRIKETRQDICSPQHVLRRCRANSRWFDSTSQ